MAYENSATDSYLYVEMVPSVAIPASGKIKVFKQFF